MPSLHPPSHISCSDFSLELHDQGRVIKGCSLHVQGFRCPGYPVMAGFGNDLKDDLIPTPLPQQRHLSLDQVSQSCIQPVLEHFQRRPLARGQFVSSHKHALCESGYIFCKRLLWLQCCPSPKHSTLSRFTCVTGVIDRPGNSSRGGC